MKLEELTRHDLGETVFEKLVERYNAKEALIGADAMRYHERMIMLSVIDGQWKDHLLSLDHLKEGINLRGYGQKDPLVEYKKESYILFQDLMDRIEDETVRYLFFVRFEHGNRPDLPFETEDVMDEGEEEEDPLAIAAAEEAERQRKAEEERQAAQRTLLSMTRKIEKKKDQQMADLQFVGGNGTNETHNPIIKGKKVGRNEPCPCGSGKKYKQCHGA